MPLFIIGAGLSEIWVGIFIASTQFPLLFVQFRLHKFISKFGTKRLMNFAFIYLTIITILLFLIPNIYLAIFLLFTTSLALGFVEPIKEIYFFKSTKRLDEEKHYPIFTTGYSFGRIFGKLFIAGVLLILPQSFAYIGISILMGLTAVVTFSLKDYRR